MPFDFNDTIKKFPAIVTIKIAQQDFIAVASVFAENLLPDWRGYSVVSLFAIFFPSATGILSGCNLSGQIKVLEGLMLTSDCVLKVSLS